ncbi:UPF0258 protein KIAA1024 isoform X2 [Lingula anatina]|uniref:UPF0258 protein KIAA1024 isoform X2 n=1 Tax=Lingula anatina TaxID=7574 RepID=A0A1S3JL22_LINAN|nr:UPF0258 protein KIAA1024 isoform X2 [Lingula anatina]|eukprot:XP_013410604.1 UPF0258 protein KIAA1024 isoform X2 [Lingula anatina]
MTASFNGGGALARDGFVRVNPAFVEDEEDEAKRPDQSDITVQMSLQDDFSETEQDEEIKTQTVLANGDANAVGLGVKPADGPIVIASNDHNFTSEKGPNKKEKTEETDRTFSDSNWSLENVIVNKSPSHGIYRKRDSSVSEYLRSSSYLSGESQNSLDRKSVSFTRGTLDNEHGVNNQSQLNMQVKMQIDLKDIYGKRISCSEGVKVNPIFVDDDELEKLEGYMVNHSNGINGKRGSWSPEIQRDADESVSNGAVQMTLDDLSNPIFDGYDALIKKEMAKERKKKICRITTLIVAFIVLVAVGVGLGVYFGSPYR